MSKTQLTKNDFYPLADYHPDIFIRHNKVMAQWTGEKRTPKDGEWYLSGAIIEAYQAKNDLTTAYHIAKLYRVVTETKEIITPVQEIR
jgi:hypothetical protein